MFYTRFAKRFIDVVLSFVITVIIFIPMAIVALITVLDSPGPVFFRQKRVGMHKKTFYIYKFRSMPTDVPHDIPTHLFRAEDMLSPWQRFIRKMSIDELPQLINIFRGEMSFIGPRPALYNQDDLVAERDKYGANDVLPGLTGYAQINGRDELPIDVKAKYDGYYAEHIGFLLDCKCFFDTIGKVLRHEGVVEGGDETLRKEASMSNTEK